VPSTWISYEDEDIGFTSCNTGQNPPTMFAVGISKTKLKKKFSLDPHFEPNTWYMDTYTVAIRKFNKTMNDIQITYVSTMTWWE
jgi:hypothetical protein